MLAILFRFSAHFGTFRERKKGLRPTEHFTIVGLSSQSIETLFLEFRNTVQRMLKLHNFEMFGRVVANNRLFRNLEHLKNNICFLAF